MKGLVIWAIVTMVSVAMAAKAGEVAQKEITKLYAPINKAFEDAVGR